MAMDLRWNMKALEAEYARLLPTLEPIHHALPRPAQEAWEANESSFFAGEPEALVTRVRDLLPGSFGFPLQQSYAEHRVNLRWSLWSADGSIWDERAAEVLDDMRAAFASGKCVVHTAPSKEIRYGTVVIERGEAHVDFVAVWDPPSSLAPDDASERHVQAIADWFEEYHDGDPEDPVAAHVEKNVKADTFEELLAAIDKCEEQLLADETKRSAAFDEFLATLHESQEV